ncbi:pheromone A receptor-domain-containing protein [Mycena amicta]|nr:pheromone A receptor-domain-containing protein [Mycena amicta]
MSATHTTHSHLLYSAAVINTLVFIFLPLYPQLRAWNTGTVFLVVWISLSCLNGVVNAALWVTTDDTDNWVPWFCEISVVLASAAMMGVPCAALAINRRFYLILQNKIATESMSLVRMVVADSAICLVPAIPYVAIPFVSQVHSPRRFDILASVGCVPAFNNNAVTYVLGYAPPILVSLAALGYGLLSGAAAGTNMGLDIKKRVDFKNVFSPYLDLSFWRYVRTTTFASGGLIVFFLPSTILSITALPTLAAVADDTGGHLAVDDWSADFTAQTAVEFVRWGMGPLYAFFVFVLLGVGVEAFRGYVRLNDRLGEVWTSLWCCCSRPRRRQFGLRVPCLPGRKKAAVDDEIELETSNRAAREPSLPVLQKAEYAVAHPISLNESPTARSLVVKDTSEDKSKGCDFRHGMDSVLTHNEGRYIFRDPETGKFADSPRVSETTTGSGGTAEPNLASLSSIQTPTMAANVG